MPRKFIYYSERKIDEYRKQIDEPRWKRALKALSRVNQLGVIVLGNGLTIGVGPPADEPVFRALQTMWIDLADNDLIGDFDEPKDYVYGELEFFYGFFDNVDPPLFVCVGATATTIIVLGGSQTNTRAFRDRKVKAKKNATPVVLEPDMAIALIEAEDPVAAEKLRESFGGATSGVDLRAAYAGLLYRNWHGYRGERMRFEVLASSERVFAVSPEDAESRSRVLFGSPVFVAEPRVAPAV